MTPIDGLPEGLTARPLTHDDAEAVTAVVAAEEVVDLGEPEITVEDVLSDWLRPSYDITTSTLGVLDGDLLVAYGDHSGPDIGYTAVLPAYQGRGIGTAIARWLQDRARAAGSPRIGTQVALGSAADRLLADLGYEVRWTAWDLELPADREISARPLPDGFVLRDAEEPDRVAAWTLVEDCFLEWADRERMSLADFGARVWDRGGFEPWNLRLLVSPDGEVVGATHVFLAGDGGYVARIAVRRGQRGRGLAPAMLSTARSAATSPPTPGRERGGCTRRSAWRSRRRG